MFRAVLRKQVVEPVSDQVQSDPQTFHPTLEKASLWARKMKAPGKIVEVYEIVERLVETVSE